MVVPNDSGPTDAANSWKMPVPYLAQAGPEIDGASVHAKLPLSQAFAKTRLPTKAAPLFMGEMKPADISRRFGPLRWTMPVLIFNRDRRWVKATANIFRKHQAKLCFESEVAIHGGASGGPIITGEGKLIGLVSQSNEPANGRAKYFGEAARPVCALPIWAIYELTGEAKYQPAEPERKARRRKRE
jgi:hypothetical protein